jgi:glycosyltransferase involved in cell wall biosynthesis
MRKTVYFVKYYDKGSTVLGADQMADGLRALGVDARSIYASELPGLRDSIVVFVKRGNWPHLLRARFTGNRCVLDVQDQVVFRGYISHWPGYDAFIFRTERQRRDFGRRVRWMGNLWARHATLYQHWDPRYRPHEVPEGEFRVAYLGTRRSLAFWEALPEVEFVEDDWFERAPAFNLHLSVRATRKGWRYKPGAKVVTAAACDAVLLTTPDDASVELLGEDYPFYIGEASREGIQATIDRAREERGGPAWRLALERLREIREAYSLERVSERYLELFERIA